MGEDSGIRPQRNAKHAKILEIIVFHARPQDAQVVPVDIIYEWMIMAVLQNVFPAVKKTIV